MPEYLAPGVYVEEIEIGAKPIEGVSTSTAGFLGEAERGPTTPLLVTSLTGFQRGFGSYFGATKYLPYSVEGFFSNGGQRCYIGRIVKSSATAATFQLKQANARALTVEAAGEGAWGNRIAIRIGRGSLSGFRLRVFYWKEAPASLFDPDADSKRIPRPTVEEAFDNLSTDETSPDYFGKRVNGISALIQVTKTTADSGSIPELGHEGTAKAGSTSTTINLADNALGTDDAYNGMLIEITEGKGKGQIKTITDYAGNTKVATVESDWKTGEIPDVTSKYRIYWFTLLSDGFDSLIQRGTARGGDNNSITLSADASAVDDTYNGLKIEILSGTGKGQIRTISDYTGGTTQSADVGENWTTQPDATSVYRIFDDSPLKSGDFLRTDTDTPGKRKGLTGFREIDEISIVYSPDAQTVPGLVGALIADCETLKDRFAVIDSSLGSANVSTLNPRSDFDTKYAAFYYPWVKVFDPQAGLRRLIPPGGHVAGVYARSDIERGVHKAPANEVARGVVELEFNITKGEQDILNPRGVNVIRAFPGRGIRVWGARTLSSDPLWKYINVRRLFLFLEESIDEGTQWVVFEPNNEQLWARVKQTITQFLTTVWRTGALMGTTPEEAFFVKVDRTTMTQDDIDNGRLIVLIGVAPTKPAEFVIFRIAQFTAGAETA